MNSQDKRSRYDARMHRVLQHIDRHLDQSLALADLAQVAHFSTFHFHRLFAAWMGETLGDYQRRRRLETSATRLVAQPRVPVLQIALSVGFGSAEAFSRAFKSRLGCSPSAWRRQQASRGKADGNLNQAKRKIDQASQGVSPEHEASHNQAMEFLMEVKLIDRKPKTVAYLRHVGPYGTSISLFWQSRAYPWLLTNGLLERPRYGICHDDPRVTAPEQCRYDACAEVADDFVPAGGAQKATIPGGRYAVLEVREPAKDMPDAWAAMLAQWLPSSGFQLDSRPFFEYYPQGSGCDPETGAFDCQICIPVAPL
ncbi:MAG: GyrI-like domain-containing protein [Rhodoferax sp.]|uniref:AraC family transcriptional regulator n=1 Tax=Rhodoferax sp. TaxID=50421 RepID=UPI002633A1D9|nr:GyrI-like domain-containing protein [Rhodoferax sp.]MDD5334690.1 GyrI-like domain-containing protein [Rhodoferax sp.]